MRMQDSNLPVRPPATDLVFGQLKDAHASLATDPILLKSDMFPTYHLASVVDDYEMKITHVLRGEVRPQLQRVLTFTHFQQEWLLSYPLHLDLYACLKLPTPQFAHIPILLNADGSKMSKRNGDVQVIDYIVDFALSCTFLTFSCSPLPSDEAGNHKPFLIGSHSPDGVHGMRRNLLRRLLRGLRHMPHDIGSCRKRLIVQR
jgi:glutamyl/glutaminyl-tRNA synthetase